MVNNIAKTCDADIVCRITHVLTVRHMTTTSYLVLIADTIDVVKPNLMDRVCSLSLSRHCHSVSCESHLKTCNRCVAVFEALVAH
jgi:hypothetical protein